MDTTRRPKKRHRAIPALLRTVKGLLVSGSEMLLAIALVLFFALVFFGILILSFPKGTGFVNFYDEMVESGGRRSDLQLRSMGEDAPFVAVLQTVQRRVRDRPADAFTWSDAHAGMRLKDHHTIQTLGRSAAEISFGDRGRLAVGERSLVVVKQDDEQSRRRRRASVVLLGGRVNGAIEAGRGRSPLLDVVTPGGSSEIRARGEIDTEFSVAVNPDESSTVSIYTGTAEIETEDGLIRVGPNEALTYDASGLIGGAVPIPDPPRPLAPANGHVRTFGSVAPRVEFRWEEREGIDSYYFVLSRDREFSDVVYDGALSRNRFVHGDLRGGRYYWRVTAISERVESLPSPVRSMRLVQDLEPPELQVALPEDFVTGEELVIRGTAEPGSELYIENESIPLEASGAFEYALKLKRGLNMIVVEAVDAAGNSAYRPQYVTARF
jgi:hypothetical protein